MGRLPIATFVACAMAAAPCALADAPEHDLDRPGALQVANLHLSSHVKEEIEKAQQIRVGPSPGCSMPAPGWAIRGVAAGASSLGARTDDAICVPRKTTPNEGGEFMPSNLS